MAKLINISGMIGDGLLHRLIELTDKANDDWKKLLEKGGNPSWMGHDWESENVFMFFLNEKVLFKLQLKPTRNQPGNGLLEFWDENVDKWGEAPMYNKHTLDILSDTEFPLQYRSFLTEELNCKLSKVGTHFDQQSILYQPIFQLSVLFQFEIARRVEGDHSVLPTRKQTEDAIAIALQLGTRKAHETLIWMFNADQNNYSVPVRLQKYIELRYMAKKIPLPRA